MELSVEMAESAIADGITHVVATPHASSEYKFDYLLVRQLRRELQTRVGDRLTLGTGCDFHVSPENLQVLWADARRFCINQRDYLLVEFDEYSIPPAMDQTLHEMQLASLRPVITHPERNAILHAQPERLTKWVQMGCYVQITGGSLTGGFGATAQKDALNWVGQGLAHFVASDAHNMSGRPIKLRPAFNLVREQFGGERARALFVENPMAAFEGRELPYIPQIPEEAAPRRKRFFFF
jgi:protein-tyrosine phosphatase